MIEKLKAYLKTAPFDAALIEFPENRMYFTGFASSDGYLIATKDEAIFITDGRYIEAAQNIVKDCRVVLQGRKISQLKEILDSLNVKSVAVEAERMTLKEYSMLVSAFGDIEIIADGVLDTAITKIRSIKDNEEVEKIIKAQRIAEKAFENILSFIKVGVTEKEIALELDYFMLKNGADALSFETIAISGKNTSMPHGVPTNKRVEDGDFVTMDFGAVVDGYHSDMTRTVAVGKVSEEQKKVYETVLAAQKNAIETVKMGVSCKDADLSARDVIEAAGYGEYFTHSTGHGVGVEIHEFPNLSPLSENSLEIGNIVTVEPGIYIPEKFGVRIEDMVLITENGCKNLTNAPKDLIIL